LKYVEKFYRVFIPIPLKPSKETNDKRKIPGGKETKKKK
jgi:hypothetical protein